jgi:hypothetical protein
MVRQAVAMFLTVGAIVSVRANERDVVARFDGGVGVIPVSNGAGPVNPDGTFPNVKLNIVRGVPPGAGPWRIADLKAEIDQDGRIKARGRGLLLASSNSIGQNAGQSVFATLICEPIAPFVEHNSTITPLGPDGDFRIDDVLNPLPPTECASPVLLIRNAVGTWFAAGIPKLGDD